MPIRHIGYPCINMSLGENVKTGRKTILRLFSIDKAAQLALQNCRDLLTILEWNAKNGISFFRIGSDIFPFMTHGTVGYKLSELSTANEIQKILQDVGTFVKMHKMRLNCHPGPFTIIASPKDDVVKSAIRDIEMHSMIGDLLGIDTEESRFNINFHIGSTYGDIKSTVKRFCENFKLLTPNAQNRVTVENDDKTSLYSAKDLVDLVHQEIGIPIVFDYHHHQFNTGNLSDVDAAKLCFNTWGKQLPEIHYSESAVGKRPTAHSDYIDGKLPQYDREFDLMLECKAKDLALLRLRSTGI